VTVELKAKLLTGGVRVFRGTPQLPLTAPALFLSIRRISEPRKPSYAVASLSMARPGPDGCVLKEMISDMELAPDAAVEKAVDIAVRGGVRLIYLNADLAKMGNYFDKAS